MGQYHSLCREEHYINIQSVSDLTTCTAGECVDLITTPHPYFLFLCRVVPKSDLTNKAFSSTTHKAEAHSCICNSFVQRSGEKLQYILIFLSVCPFSKPLVSAATHDTIMPHCFSVYTKSSADRCLTTTMTENLRLQAIYIQTKSYRNVKISVLKTD